MFCFIFFLYVIFIFIFLYFRCGEKETLDLKKLLTTRNDSVRDNKTGYQGIWFSFQLINGDIKQVTNFLISCNVFFAGVNNRVCSLCCFVMFYCLFLWAWGYSWWMYLFSLSCYCICLFFVCMSVVPNDWY